MSRLYRLGFCVLLALCVAIPVAAQEPVQGEPVPVRITGDFMGQSQYHSLGIVNTGTLTLYAHDLVGWEGLDEGRMTLKMEDGRVLVLRNMWNKTQFGSFTVWVWNQTLPEGVARIYIEDPKVPIVWEPVGPFSPHPDGGFYLTETFTQIHLRVVPWEHRGNTWTWRLIAEPSWAANQWPWEWWVLLTAEIPYSCAELVPGNRDVAIHWGELYPGAMYTVKVPKGWVRDSAGVLPWRVSYPDGETQTGETVGPFCAPPSNRRGR
jgi:hypothetical protein